MVKVVEVIVEIVEFRRFGRNVCRLIVRVPQLYLITIVFVPLKTIKKQNKKITNAHHWEFETTVSSQSQYMYTPIHIGLCRYKLHCFDELEREDGEHRRNNWFLIDWDEHYTSSGWLTGLGILLNDGRFWRSML